MIHRRFGCASIAVKPSGNALKATPQGSCQLTPSGG
jgi:hypothetical protein